MNSDFCSKYMQQADEIAKKNGLDVDSFTLKGEDYGLTYDSNNLIVSMLEFGEKIYFQTVNECTEISILAKQELIKAHESMISILKFKIDELKVMTRELMKENKSLKSIDEEQHNEIISLQSYLNSIINGYTP